MIEPVTERRARDGDAKASHIGEVRKPKPGPALRLARDHIPRTPLSPVLECQRRVRSRHQLKR
jgi:hypothetical protein